MNEWDQGLAKWHSNKVRSKFRKKYGRSVGSRSGVRKSNLKGKKQKIVLSYSDRKIDAEWAKGVYSRNFQIQINRALRRFKQIKSFDAELSGSEWNDDFENWENLRLFSKSWKWIKPKKLNRAGRNFLKRKITRRIKKNVDLSHFQKVHDKIYCVPSYESVEKSLIYVYRHGVQFGPYTKKRLQSLIDIGKFEYSDLGFAKKKYWLPLSCIEGLFFQNKTKEKISIPYTSSSYGYEQVESRKTGSILVFLIIFILFTPLFFLFDWGKDNGLDEKTFTGNDDLVSDDEEKNKFRTILNEILNESADEMPVIVEDKKELLGIELIKPSEPKSEDSTPVFIREEKSPSGLLGKSKIHVVPSIQAKMIWCSSGSFLMGSPKDEEGRDDNEKLHSVSVEKGFYIDQFELKQRAWKIVMNGNPSFWKDDDLPIESVSWIDAMEFCNRLTILERDKKRLPLDWSFTLPTEAQWEYACRAGSNSAFNCGDELSSDEANIDGSIQYGASRIGRKSFGTIKCGSFNPNKFGLYDMHGNVWEWCRDWYAKDNLKYTNGSIPEKGLYKVKRGGSWFNGAHSVRSAKRFYSSNKYKNQTLGFRIVLINQ